MNHQKLLKEYHEGVELIFTKVNHLSEEVLSFRPDMEDAWTIKEHLIHLVDSEINGFIRCKSIIAQPFSNCFVMDENNWTKNIRRKNEDLKKYLAVFKLIREIICDLLQDEDDANWTKDYFIRTYQNETKQITIEKCIELYRNHVQFHLEYIERNVIAFNNR